MKLSLGSILFEVHCRFIKVARKLFLDTVDTYKDSKTMQNFSSNSIVEFEAFVTTTVGNFGFLDLYK